MATKIDSVLDPLLEYHLDRLDAQASGSYAPTLTPEQRLRTSGTVKIDLGRQLGQSQYIARTAQIGDLILTKDPYGRNLMASRVSSINGASPEPTVKQLVAKLRLEGSFSDVWIDAASYIPQEFIDELYAELAGRCRRFILIG